MIDSARDGLKADEAHFSLRNENWCFLLVSLADAQFDATTQIATFYATIALKSNVNFNPSAGLGLFQ